MKIDKYNIDAVLLSTVNEFSMAIIYDRHASLQIELGGRKIDLQIIVQNCTTGYYVAGNEVDANEFWKTFDTALERLQKFSSLCGDFTLSEVMLADFMAAKGTARWKVVQGWKIPSNFPSFDLTVEGLISWYETYTR